MVVWKTLRCSPRPLSVHIKVLYKVYSFNFVGYGAYNRAMQWNVSMTSLLMHAVTHSTRHSFKPKINNQPSKKLSLAVNWLQVVKNCKVLTFTGNFLCQKLSEYFIFFDIEGYHFRGTIFCYWHVWKLHFLKRFIFLNNVQFLTTFTQLTARLKNFLRSWLWFWA